MISGDEQNPLKYFKNFEEIWNSIFNYFPTKIANLDRYYNRCDRTLNSLNKSLAKDKQIEIRQIKYLNNVVEQDHRFIKKRTRPMLGFKSFNSAKITITGIENIRMIQKGQIVGGNNKLSVFENFAILMA